MYHHLHPLWSSRVLLAHTNVGHLAWESLSQMQGQVCLLRSAPAWIALPRDFYLGAQHNMQTSGATNLKSIFRAHEYYRRTGSRLSVDNSNSACNTLPR